MPRTYPAALWKVLQRSIGLTPIGRSRGPVHGVRSASLQQFRRMSAPEDGARLPDSGSWLACSSSGHSTWMTCLSLLVIPCFIVSLAESLTVWSWRSRCDSGEEGVHAVLEHHQRKRHNLSGVHFADVGPVGKEKAAIAELDVNPEAMQIFQSSDHLDEKVNVRVDL